MISPQYLAGIIDGEGNVSIIKRIAEESRINLTFVPTVRISMTRAKELIEEIAEQYEGRFYSRKRKKGYREIYIVMFTCRQVEPVLKAVLPYLRIKKRQANLLLEFNGLRKWGGHVPKSVLKRQVEIYNKVRRLNSSLKGFKPLKIDKIPDSKQPRYFFNKKEVTRLYWEEKLGGPEIAKKYGCSSNAIYNFMHNNGIPTRDKHQVIKLMVKTRKRHTMPPKEELIEFYNKKKFSLREIGCQYDAGATTIASWFKKYNIPMRTLEEALKARFSSY